MSKLHLCLAVILSLTRYLHFGISQEVNTNNGPIRGATISVMGKEVDVFHGIPFAKPPVGRLRFKHPQPPDSWTPNVKYAIQEKPSCLQPLEAFTFPEDYRQTPESLSEDCLYLSLWKSSMASPGANLPVMFWIYGGGWGIGSTRLQLYNGQYLAAENNVIVVSANYRLGPLGFGFLSVDTIPGNMGLLDQVIALKWVKDNIYNFGGDPNQVTIFGESAGAVSVGLHLLSPLSRDLFKYAILQSGSPVQNVGRHVYQDDVTARSALVTFANNVGCENLFGADLFTCLQSVNAEVISPAFMKSLPLGVSHGPVVDRYFLPDDPRTLMNTGNFKKTKIMQGFTKDESTVLMYPILVNFTRDGLSRQKYLNIINQYIRLTDPKYEKEVKALRLFYEDFQDPLTPINYIDVLNQLRNDLEFTCRAVDFSSYYADTVSNGSYMYSFNHRMSTSRYPHWIGATHTYELEFVFGLALNESLGFTQEETDLSRNMMTYWTNFAKSGNPNQPVELRTKWGLFDAKMMRYLALDVGYYMATEPRLHHQQCTFINKILPLIGEDDHNHKEPLFMYPVSSGSSSYWNHWTMMTVGVMGLPYLVTRFTFLSQ